MYAATLKLHKERSRVGMTDKDILDRLLHGNLFLDPHTATVWIQKDRTRSMLTVIEHESPNGGTYRFVTVCKGGKKKRIALHRLVWIYVHGRLPKPNHDIHHKRGTRVLLDLLFPDGIDNLEEVPSEVNRDSSLTIPSEDF